MKILDVKFLINEIEKYDGEKLNNIIDQVKK